MTAASHFFFALSLPEDVKAAIGEKSHILEKQLPFKKWLHPEDYHITLAFLGNAEEDMLTKALRLAEDALSGEQPFRLKLAHAGVFGPSESPRILWIGTEPSSPLTVIRDHVYNASLQAGFSLDKKPFKPHITIARKCTAPDFSLDKLAGTADIYPEAFTARTVTLYRTHIGKRPSYEPVHSISLHEAGSEEK